MRVPLIYTGDSGHYLSQVLPDTPWAEAAVELDGRPWRKPSGSAAAGKKAFYPIAALSIKRNVTS